LRVLLIGKSGMLGSCFLKLMAAVEDFEMYALDRDDLDICDYDALREFFKRTSPDFVINCAAYTAVDSCEDNRDLAFQVNAKAPGEIARVCKEENAILVHFSTDYVFDGSKDEGFDEDDLPNPINCYGESKLEGERAIMDATDKYYIVRTSWLFGEGGKNFVDTMIELAKDENEIKVVDDQIGSPTYTLDLVKAVIETFLAPHVQDLPHQHAQLLVERSNNHKKAEFGVYHITNSGRTSWYDFAARIFEIMEIDVELVGVTSAEFGSKADRPKVSLLNSTKVEPLRTWSEAVESYLRLNYAIK